MRYIHRNIGRVLEDIAPVPRGGLRRSASSRPAASDYVMTNPSAGTPTMSTACSSARASRIRSHDYDAVELTCDRRFMNNWWCMASYRWSRLHGTYEGFFRDDNGQSDPGITSLYDFPTNDPTYTAIGGTQFGYQGDIRFLGELGAGPLPLDRPHQFKFFGNYASRRPQPRRRL